MDTNNIQLYNHATNSLLSPENLEKAANKVKTCFIYVRVSSDEQVKGYSLDGQRQACIAFGKKLGYRILGVFRDEGETATATERPQFQEMLNKCEESRIDAIIVWHTDRFARMETDHFMVKDKLSKQGTALLSVSQPMLDESPEGKFLDTILAGVNAYYSRDLGRKTKKGLNQKWEQGGWPSAAPPGYRNIRSDKDKGEIEVNPVTGPIIKEGLESFATGNYTIVTLQKWLHERGIRSRTGKVISFAVVHNMLRNPFYYGLMRWDKKEQMGTFEPLISEEIFRLNQYILVKHRGFMIRQRKHDFLLSSFAFCSHCGYRYVAEWHFNAKKFASRGGKIGYYHCAHCRKFGNRLKNVEISKLEDLVAEKFTMLEFSPEFIAEVTRQAREYFESQRGIIEKQKQAIMNQQKGLAEKRDKLEDMLLDNTVSRDTFKRKHMVLESQISALDERIAELDRKRQIDVNFIDEVLAVTRNIYEAYRAAPDFLKRHYLRFFFEQFFIKGEEINNTILSPFFTLLVKENLGYIKTRNAPPPRFELGTFSLQVP